MLIFRWIFSELPVYIWLLKDAAPFVCVSNSGNRSIVSSNVNVFVFAIRYSVSLSFASVAFTLDVTSTIPAGGK